VLRVLISGRRDTQFASKGETPESMRALAPASKQMAIEDDRHQIIAGDAVLLVVEDDPIFARILLEMAHDRGLKVLIAVQGKAAIALAREFNPAAVTLDISLPDMEGWSLLDRFKHDPMTRHIPVHIISGDDDRRRGLALGAMTYIQKASDQAKLSDTFGLITDATRVRTKKVLLVGRRNSQIRDAVFAKDVEITQVTSEQECLSVVTSHYLDGVIIETPVSGMNIGHLIADIHAAVMPHTPPIIIYAPDGQHVSEITEARFLISPGAVRSANSIPRLLDETVVLWHRHEGDLSELQREQLAEARTVDLSLVGRKVLVVDDDIRNIFALTSALQHQQIEVVHASNGADCLTLLALVDDIDVIFMDIMMPGMDGYQTMREVRSRSKYASIPIVAVTAKAMSGDREKCLEAGATDYVAKPVDLEQLFAVLRVSLKKKRTEIGRKDLGKVDERGRS
jgi:CheY-like chemotaxis protein